MDFKFKISEVKCEFSNWYINIQVGPYKLGSVQGIRYITTIGQLKNFKTKLGEYILKYA